MSIITHTPARTPVGANPFIPTRGLFPLEGCSFVTAVVVTRNSRYVVVVRPTFGVRVICPDGAVLFGTHLHMVRGRLFVRDNDEDVTLLHTTAVLDVQVLEN